MMALGSVRRELGVLDEPSEKHRSRTGCGFSPLPVRLLSEGRKRGEEKGDRKKKGTFMNAR
jgi:hypothetical protein